MRQIKYWKYKILYFSVAFKHREHEMTASIDLRFVCLNHGYGSDLETKAAIMSTKAIVNNMVYVCMYMKMCCGMAWPWDAVQFSSDFRLVSDSKKDCHTMRTML